MALCINIPGVLWGPAFTGISGRTHPGASLSGEKSGAEVAGRLRCRAVETNAKVSGEHPIAVWLTLSILGIAAGIYRPTLRHTIEVAEIVGATYSKSGLLNFAVSFYWQHSCMMFPSIVSVRRDALIGNG